MNDNNKAKFCPNCGNQLVGNEKFCNVCGQKVMPTVGEQQANGFKKNSTSGYADLKKTPKKNGCLKIILIGAGILILLFVVLAMIGSEIDSDETTMVTSLEIESKTSDAIETEILAETETNFNSESVEHKQTKIAKDNTSLNISKSNVDISLSLDNYGKEFENPFSISESQKAFIDGHLSFFPADYSDLKNMVKYIDYSLDYSHMIKNPQRYSGKLAYLEDLTIAQIWESSISDNEYDNITELNLYDSNDNLYRILYVGKSIDAVENDMIRVVAMPVAYSAYTNTVGEQKLTLVMIASLFEHIDRREISQDFFMDEPDEVGATVPIIQMEDEDYILPGSDYRYYSERELSAYTKEQLRLGRNEIYARHGRIFESEDLNNYFQNQSWYYGTVTADEFDDSILNEYEKENLDAIKAVEASK